MTNSAAQSNGNELKHDSSELKSIIETINDGSMPIRVVAGNHDERRDCLPDPATFEHTESGSPENLLSMKRTVDAPLYDKICKRESNRGDKPSKRSGTETTRRISAR